MLILFSSYYLSQKKTLEVNPRHPLIKELLRRVDADKEDGQALSMANLMFETATLRSGYMLTDTSAFAQRVESLLRQNLGIDESAAVEEDEDDFGDDSTPDAVGDAEEIVADDVHEEL